MKKLFKSALIVVLLAGVSCSLSSCGGNEEKTTTEESIVQPSTDTTTEESKSPDGSKEDVENLEGIKKISTVASTTMDNFDADTLEEGIKKIQIKVYKNSGDIDIVNADKSMFSEEDWVKLTTTPGENSIRVTLTYEGFKLPLSITVTKKIEVNHDGKLKLEFTLEALRAQLIEGDTIPKPEEADTYVWSWKKMENEKDEKGEFSLMEEGNVSYINPEHDRCLVVFIEKDKPANWSYKIDQTQNLTIEDGKVLIPTEGLQGINQEFKLDLFLLKSTLKYETELPAEYTTFALLKGGVRTDYLVPVKEDGTIKGDSLTQTVQLFILPAGENEYTATIDKALAKSDVFGVGKIMDGPTTIFKYQEVMMDMKDLLPLLSGTMPEYDDAYIYAFGGDAKIFVSATISNGVIKAFIPSDSNNAVMLFVKEGEQPKFIEGETVQSKDLEVRDGKLVLKNAK